MQRTAHGSAPVIVADRDAIARGAAGGVHAGRYIRRARWGARLGRGHARAVDPTVCGAAFAMQDEAHGSA